MDKIKTDNSWTLYKRHAPPIVHYASDEGPVRTETGQAINSHHQALLILWSGISPLFIFLKNLGALQAQHDTTSAH